MPDKLNDLNDFAPKQETPEEIAEVNSAFAAVNVRLLKCIELAERDLAAKRQRENK